MFRDAIYWCRVVAERLSRKSGSPWIEILLCYEQAIFLGKLLSLSVTHAHPIDQTYTAVVSMTLAQYM